MSKKDRNFVTDFLLGMMVGGLFSVWILSGPKVIVSPGKQIVPEQKIEFNGEGGYDTTWIYREIK